MKVGILECGMPPAALVPRHGTYATMVHRMLGPAHETRVFEVTRGALPDAATACDAYVVTGSPAGVYDDLPWIAGLLDFLREVRGEAKLVGLCFGHQAIAAARGGAVLKSPKGWGLGLHRYAVGQHAAWMDQATTALSAAASHQDQVVTCPPGARVIAHSAFTPYAGLDYGDALSFQFHPEFETGFATALIDATRDRYGPLADTAVASYAGPNDGAKVGGWVRAFLG